MTIKRKLLLISLLAGVVFIGSVLLFLKGLTDIREFDEIKANVIHVSAKTLILRREEKDFLARHDLKYSEAFKQNSAALETDLQTLATALDGQGKAEIDKLRQALQNYAVLFLEIVELQKRVGLDEKSGLYGALRESAHHVESVLAETRRQQLLHDLLMLRRHEKDFMLRRDPAYAEKFKASYQAMLGALEADTQFDAATKSTLLEYLEHYRQDFLTLVEAETDKGLGHEDGKLGKMRGVVHTTDEALATLETVVTAIMDEDIRFYQVLIFLIVTLGFSASAWAIYSITREILRQVGGEPARIAAITEQVAGGNLDVDVSADTGEASGIYASVQKMVRSLREVNAERERQNWLKTGQAQLNEKISGDQSIVQLAENVINFLTPYAGAQVGAFYLAEGAAKSGIYLKMLASHAYIWRSNLSNRYKLGEGLVGQAALEHKPIMVTDLPREHVRIDSGLGESSPSAVLIVPFLYEGELKGVIELAAVHEFSKAQREFLEQVMPAVAIAVNTAESRSRLQELLEQSQAQAEELQAQTEELRAQQEELQAQQEELRQTNEELEMRSRELERREQSFKKAGTGMD